MQVILSDSFAWNRGILLSFFAACVAALALTPVFRMLAARLGLVAKPNPLVKSHTKPTAYLGGVAVYGAFAASVLIANPSTKALSFAGLAGLMVLLGIIDDWKPLPPSRKLLGQTVISILALAVFAEPGWPWFVYPALLFWLLLCSNALNLVDVMDGLATGLSCCALVGLAILAAFSGFGEMALICAALTGAGLGFLPFNWNRASIFLGDAGSLFFGFAVGLAPLLQPERVLNLEHWLFNFVAVAVPVFEVAFLFVMRTKAGKPFWRGSKDHFSLRLLHAGWPIQRIVALTHAIAAAFVATALLCLLRAELSLWPSAIFVIAVLAFLGAKLAKIRI